MRQEGISLEPPKPTQDLSASVGGGTSSHRNSMGTYGSLCEVMWRLTDRGRRSTVAGNLQQLTGNHWINGLLSQNYNHTLKC